MTTLHFIRNTKCIDVNTKLAPMDIEKSYDIYWTSACAWYVCACVCEREKEGKKERTILTPTNIRKNMCNSVCIYGVS